MGQKIAWFTEGGWSGKIPRNHRGMRNDSAWMCVLDAIHYPIWESHNIQEKYDLLIYLKNVRLQFSQYLVKKWFRLYMIILMMEMHGGMLEQLIIRRQLQVYMCIQLRI